MTLPDILTTAFISALTATIVTVAVIVLMAIANRGKWDPVPKEQPPASWLAKQGGDQ